MIKKLRVRAIIEHDGLYLLVRNKYTPNFWCLPGGGVEQNEDIISALEREIIEELGIKPDVGNLLYVHTLKGGNGYELPAFYFHIKNGQDYVNFEVSSSSHGKLELLEAKFLDITNAHVLPSFLKHELPELRSSDFKHSTIVRTTDLE